MTFSASYQQCDGSRAAEYGQPYKPSADEKIMSFFVCQGQSLDANGDLLVALGTVTIAIFTLTLWRSTERAGEHFRVTERAYVKLSHTPPGAQFTTDLGQPAVVVQLQVKNFGHTPAYVTDVYLDVRILEEDEQLPPIPEYQPIDGRVPVEGFLVADDLFYHQVVMGVTHAQWKTTKEENGRLIVLGYVDYRDKFGDTHRGAYAREYDGDMDTRERYETDKDWRARNNLPIITQARYNDDFLLIEA